MRHAIARFAVAVAVAVTACVVPVGGATAHAARSGRAPMDAVVPVSVPAAPIVVESTGAGLGLWVAWLPDDSADAVTWFTIAATPVAGTETAGCPAPAVVSFDALAPATGVTVPGLCAQVAYTATVVAHNDVGDSALSNVSDPAAALEAQVPGMPLIGGTLGRDGSAALAWVAPYYDGGAPVTSYSITVRDPSDVIVSDTTVDVSVTSTMITGLTNDVDYQVSLVAVNSVGASDVATATLTPRAAYAPVAPRGLQAVPDTAGGIEVSWQAPVDDGGAGVTSYTLGYQRVELLDGVWTPVDGAPNHTMTTDAATLTVVATDFEDPAASYLFTVAAVNSVGTGDAAVSQSAASPNVVIRDTTNVLDEATVAELDQVTESELVWWDPVPAQVLDLAVGDVVVAGVSSVFPGGVLREITDTNEDGDGTITLTTVNASLDNVFSSMSMSAAVSPNAAPSSTDLLQLSSSGTRFVPQTSGLQAMPATVSPSALHAGFDFSYEDTWHWQLGARVHDAAMKDTGDVAIKTTFTTSTDFSVNVTLDGILHPSMAIESAASTKSVMSLEMYIDATRDWKLWEASLSTISFPIGPVPVVIVPTLILYFQAGGHLGFKVSTETTTGSSVGWSSKSAGDLEIKDLSRPLEVTGSELPDCSLSGYAYGALKFSFVAKFYNVAGPSLSATLKLKVTLDFQPDPGQPFLDIEPSLELSAGLTLDVWSFHADVEWSLAKIVLSHFRTWDPPPVVLSVSPSKSSVEMGSSEAFTATRSDGLTKTVTWKVVGGVAGDTITSEGVFTPAGPESRYVSIQATDSDNNIGTATVWVGTPFDPPGSLTLDYSEEEQSLVASWTAPEQTGGAPIADYVITTSPDTGRHVTTETSLTIHAVKPANYTIDVRARNTADRLSPPANATYLGPGCKARVDSGGTAFTGPDPADCAPKYASGTGTTSINGLVYTIDIANPAAGATVTGYHGAPHGSAVTIAASVYIGGVSYPVTAVGNRAFIDNMLTSVTIPDSVTTIGDSAFDSNRLTSVTIPDSVTAIGWFAFKHNRLTSVAIPDSVTALGGHAFYDNRLASATIGDSVTTIDEETFLFNQLTSVTIGDSVTSIGYRAFWGNELTSLTIPDSVTSIDEKAFSDNLLDSVTFGNSLTTIGGDAFRSNLLTAVMFGPSVTTIGDFAFDDNLLTSVTLPDSVATIGVYAFANNQLTSLTIGTSVAVIGESAFAGNPLTSVTIPESVTSIGDGAFHDNLLTSVTIPNAVTTIGAEAFNSNQLTSLTIGNAVTTIGADAFSENLLASVSIGDSVADIGDYAFFANLLTSLTLPSSVTTIGEGAFCFNRLASVTMPASVTTIGPWSFSDNLLTAVTIPASITAIGDGAFNGNVLTSVTFAGEAPTVGSQAFVNGSGDFEPLISYYERNAGSGFTSPTWAVGGTEYDSQALVTVTFDANGHGSAPSPVDVVAGSALPEPGALAVSGYAFDGWFAAASGGTAVMFPLAVSADTTLFAQWTDVSVATTIGGITYAADSSNVAAGATATDYDGTTQGTDVAIPASVAIDGTDYAVTTVGAGAFLGDLLTSVTLPATVTDIGGSAFRGNLLTSVTIPGSVTTVGAHAYLENPDLSEVVFLGDVPATVGSEPFGAVGSPAGALISYYAAHASSGFTTPTWDAGGVTYRSEERGAAVAEAFAAAPAPTITGTATVGETLTAHAGTWSPAPDTFSYQWLRDGAPIAGATADTYDLAAADFGALIRVAVTATKTDYPTTTLTSAPTSAVAPGAPSVTGVSPASGSTAGGTSVTLTGSGFTGATVVTFDGVAGTALSVSSATSLTVASPAHVAGPVDVVVTTPYGSSAARTFTFVAPVSAPVVSNVSPGFGPTTGGTTVTVTGSGFTDASQVTFGGVAGTGLTVASDTALTVTTPAGTSPQAAVVVTNPAGDSGPSSFAFLDTSVVAESPVRILDTSGFTSGVVRCYPVVGLATVPDGATGVLLNVTAVGPAGNGYVVIYPDAAGNGATPAPNSSTVNFELGKDVANSAMVAIPSDGKVCAYSAGGTLSRLILDVAGYIVPGSGITVQSAQRLLDTRLPGQQVVGPVVPMVVNTVQVTGNAGVPAGATAVLANVTVVGATAEGHLRVWAAGTTVPNTSVVNYAPGQTKANGQIIALSPSGGLSFESFTGPGTVTNPVQVIIDVMGYVVAGSQFTATAPTRIVETRAAYGVVGPIPGALVPNTVYPVTLSDTTLIPSTATAVVLNVTAVGPTEFGNLRVYPDTNNLGTTTPPNASVINYIPGRAIPNMVIVQIPPDRKIDFFNNQGLPTNRTDLIVDVIGYISGTSSG